MTWRTHGCLASPSFSAVVSMAFHHHLMSLSTLIAALRFETPSFPDGKRGQGLSSEPAFAGSRSSDGTRGRDNDGDGDEAMGAQLSSAWDLTIAQALFQPQSRELLWLLTWFQGVAAANHVLHTLSGDARLHLMAPCGVCRRCRALHHHHRGPSSSFPAMR
jgi:hypothetical protein